MSILVGDYCQRLALALPDGLECKVRWEYGEGQDPDDPIVKEDIIFWVRSEDQLALAEAAIAQYSGEYHGHKLFARVWVDSPDVPEPA